MAGIDLGIIAYVALGSLRGMRSGLIRQIVSLASVIAGGVVAANLYPRLATNIDFLVSDTQVRQLVAFVAIFAGFLVLGQIAGQMLKTVASMLLLGPLDSLGGLAFGFVVSTLTIAFMLYAVTAFPAIPFLAGALEDSTLAPYFIERLPLLQRLLPATFRAAIEGYRDGGLPALPIPGLPQ